MALYYKKRLLAWYRKYLAPVKMQYWDQLKLAIAKAAVFIPNNLPDFLIIGAPRAATTWVHRRLAEHPNLFLPKRKEIHFYDQGLESYNSFCFNPKNSSHWRWYALHFIKSREKQLKGDVTPAYSILPEDTIASIADPIPDVKLIYVLRNPIDRAWSAARKNLRNEGIYDTDHLNTLLRKATSPRVLKRGDYKSNIERWEKYIQKKRILYCFYDDIVEDPRMVLRKICKFLEVDPDLLPSEAGDRQRVNKAPDIEIQGK